MAKRDGLGWSFPARAVRPQFDLQITALQRAEAERQPLIFAGRRSVA